MESRQQSRFSFLYGTYIIDDISDIFRWREEKQDQKHGLILVDEAKQWSASGARMVYEAGGMQDWQSDTQLNRSTYP